MGSSSASISCTPASFGLWRRRTTTSVATTPDHNPTYRWNAPLVRQMLTILSYAKSRGITVVLGDWENPIIGGDPRIPAEFLEQLRDVYGFTNIRYYNLISEPNLDTGCDFGCWAGIVQALSSEFASMGLNRWLQLVGPDNANNYDDMQGVQAYDRTNGLDTDAPNGGDSWVTMTLQSVPGLIGAYDSHRYATPWGIENGVYEDQMRARREEMSEPGLAEQAVLRRRARARHGDPAKPTGGPRFQLRRVDGGPDDPGDRRRHVGRERVGSGRRDAQQGLVRQ